MIKEISIKTSKDYFDSLRNRNLIVYYFGEQIDEPIDHPIIRPSV
ncbi:MAG: 4-hydroxybutyryl-CoA dehydratase/vinylacetyl-CoA-Delta-isomerase, partial [Woeseiaceae bacterium]